MQVNHLAYTFPKAPKALFTDLSFNLQSPGVNFLIGQNGAGKTTLADIITGLRQPTTGTVEGSHDAIYLNQQLPMLTSIRVCDVAKLILGIEYGRLRFQLTDLEAWADAPTYQFLIPIWHQHYSQLSGGQRKLVQLLLFLQVDRQLIVLDEPTAAVDRQNVQLLFQVMQAHPQRTYLMITHDVRDIQAFTDYQVLWLHDRQMTTLTKAAFERSDEQQAPFIRAFKSE